jgi:hypothetical protein
MAHRLPRQLYRRRIEALSSQPAAARDPWLLRQSISRATISLRDSPVASEIA